jgi:catechol 2,3-dioxygenase-like lactoylglutathione lyase family enzyme
MQIDHVTVPVRSYDAGKRFYEHALAPLGFAIRLDWPDRHRAYFGLPSEPSSLWLSQSAAAGTLELSLPAADAHAVREFHAAALLAGGASLHGPDIDLDRSAQIYAARVADPDGNVLEVIHRGLETAAADDSALAA